MSFEKDVQVAVKKAIHSRYEIAAIAEIVETDSQLTKSFRKAVRDEVERQINGKK